MTSTVSFQRKWRNACLGILAIMLGIMVYFSISYHKWPVIHNVPTRHPCEYSDHPDLRIIALTHNRHESLQKLLSSLDSLETDGDSASLEIWIDRSSKGDVDDRTLKMASNFTWKKGTSRVHIQSSHVGIYGQWMDTWCPKSDTKEIALILEDDLSVSPYAYRWLKAAHSRYGNRSDVAGYTLTSNAQTKAKGGGVITKPKKEVSFLYKLMGSHGFAPHPKVWKNFREWYAIVKQNKTFKPYVKDIIMTGWYKGFEKRHFEHSMWEMWFIYYCDQENLYTVYNNIAQVFGLTKGYLNEHRAEPGLHASGRGGNIATHLLQTWDEKYIEFPKKTPFLDFGGKIIATQ